MDGYITKKREGSGAVVVFFFLWKRVQYVVVHVGPNIKRLLYWLVGLRQPVLISAIPSYHSITSYPSLPTFIYTIQGCTGLYLFITCTAPVNPTNS
jgi:hypothetical protein